MDTVFALYHKPHTKLFHTLNHAADARVEIILT